MTHICVGNLTIIGSDNGLSPGRRQAIAWTNVGILIIGPLGTNFSEMLIEIHTFSFKKIHLKMSSGKWRPFCLGLHVIISRLTACYRYDCVAWCSSHTCEHSVNTLRPGKRAAIFQTTFWNTFLNEDIWISIWFSLKFFPKGPIDNNPTLAQLMAWRRPGDKPLPEPVIVVLPTYICVTRPQWVKTCCPITLDYFDSRCCNNTHLILCWSLVVHAEWCSAELVLIRVNSHKH